MAILMAMSGGCGPDSGPSTGSGGGSADDIGTSTLGASDTGVPFECPGARWHEGDLEIDDSVDVESLRDIGGVAGNLRVRGTSSLTDLKFLSCLQEVTGFVDLSDNAALTSLRGLERLSIVGVPSDSGDESEGALSLWMNGALEHIHELESLESIGTIWFVANPALSDISLPAIRRIGHLTLGWCDDSGVNSGNNAALFQLGEYPVLESLTYLRMEGQEGVTSLASLVEAAGRGAEFERAVFERNDQLPASEIEAFSAAAGIEAEACENRDDGEWCAPCPSD